MLIDKIRKEIGFSENIEELKDLKIPTNKGFVALSEIATVEFATGPAVINRYNRSRNITIEVETNGLQLGEVVKMVKALPSLL